MLEAANVWGQEVIPFLSSAIAAQIVSEPWQLEAYYRLRRSVFAEEQGLFDQTDVDAHDARATAIVAMAQMAGMADEVVGVVRIYPTDPDTWFGGRLGVIPRYRSRRIVGTSLICAAVSTARAFGCKTFLATIQAKNVRYFEQHHFSAIEPVEVCGQPHQLMRADLEAYPACAAWANRPVFGDVAAALMGRLRAA
jgi:putative N-acetyltransferase (TIGR04045 family)